MIVKLIKKLTPLPERRHGVKIGKKFEVIESKETDNNLRYFNEGDIWIKTKIGRIKLFKEEYEIIEEKK